MDLYQLTDMIVHENINIPFIIINFIDELIKYIIVSFYYYYWNNIVLCNLFVVCCFEIKNAIALNNMNKQLIDISVQLFEIQKYCKNNDINNDINNDDINNDINNDDKTDINIK
jgi:hypothetical protein